MLCPRELLMFCHNLKLLTLLDLRSSVTLRYFKSDGNFKAKCTLQQHIVQKLRIEYKRSLWQLSQVTTVNIVITLRIFLYVFFNMT